MGKPILVGRKTFESFDAKPLPGRTNIVITQDKNYQCEGVEIVHSINEALAKGKAAAKPDDEIMVIGGSSFYAQLLPLANRLYLTYVDGEFTADSWFPKFDESAWQVTSREPHKADEKNAFDHEFVILNRRTSDL